AVPPARVLLVALSVVLVACGGDSAAATCEERLPGGRAGLCPIAVEDREPAPADAAPGLGGDGEEASLADLRGRVVVFKVWASWGGPGRTDQPDLKEADATLPADAVAFLGVNVEDSEANALAHVREFALPYPPLYDPDNVYASRYRGVGPR